MHAEPLQRLRKEQSQPFQQKLKPWSSLRTTHKYSQYHFTFH
ncbi:hypothetical protein KSS87_022029 [Heliosperma pusillum]|nr:hypothetical protein KSS87_022029 [Heliosperma pusillum]